MKTKHTKGEWYFEGNKIYSDVAGKTLLAYLTRFYETFEYKEETKANLKLIAAAPDLLEALQLLLKSHRELSFNQNHNLNDDPVEQIAINAIKKATNYSY